MNSKLTILATVLIASAASATHAFADVTGTSPSKAEILAPKAESKTTLRHRTHKVKHGETLSGICHSYRVTLASVREINHLKGSKIKAGATLLIPDTKEKSKAV